MSAQDVRSPDRPKLHFLGADAEEERAALGTAPVLRRNSGGQAGTALRPHAMPASACELAAASRGHKVGTSPRRHSIHGNLSAAPILRRAETVGITRSARSVTLELPMWPASPQSSRSASFSAARLPSSFSAARRSSARANSFTQQCSRSQTQSVPASPSRLRRHSNSVLAHAAALQAARANGSSASGSVRVAHVSPPADRGWISPAGVPSPVESQRADGHPTLVPGVPPVPAPAGEPSRLAAAGCLCLQPLVLDVPRIGEQLPMASGAAELALSGLSGLSARSPCSASVSPSVASPCSLSCSFRDLSLGSRRPTNDAPSTIVEGADPAGTGGSFGEAATQERSQMVHGRARFESRRRLPPSDPRGAAEEGETTGPDCSANVITALLTGADERSAEQPASIAPSSSAPLQSVGSRLLQRIAYIASLGWASAPHCASASDGSSAHEGGQREAEEWPALHFSWADEIDGPERLVDVDSVASGCRFSAELVGSFSCHGCRQLGSGPVRAKVNQDAAIICHPFGPKPQRGGSGGFFDAQAASSERTAVFCVLDGHGHCGEVVSRAAGLRLCEELQAHPRLQHEPHVAMFEAFAATEAALEAELAEEEEGDEEPGWLRRASKNSGACCTLVLLRDGEIWTANAGDCRAVLGRAVHTASGDWEGEFKFDALDLSEDHKADRPDEKKRVEACGGQVQVSETQDGLWEPGRLYIDLARKGLGPGLTMSRAFGDWGARPLGFSAVPEVTRHAIHEDDRFLIIASDGLWELIESDQAVQIVGAVFEGEQPAQLAALSLITAAANRWYVLEGPGYRDDITCVVVYLHAELFPSSA